MAPTVKNLGDLNDNATSIKKYTLYTAEDVAKHNSETDAWMIIDSNVLDVTEFMESHPGGKNILLPYIGKDATEIFHNEDPHSHSKYAVRMLSKYKVGTTLEQAASCNQDFSWDTFVDLTKPIVMQIVRMSPPALYQKWLDNVQQPLSVTLFETNLLEKFSRWPWWYIFYMWIPIILTMLRISSLNAGVTTSLLNFGLGIFAWTFAEYMIHRFAFHVETETVQGNLYHFFAHGAHHLFPMDKTRLTFPPFFSAALAFLVYVIFDNSFPAMCGWQAIYAGIAFAYMMYDALHFYFHHGSPFWDSIPVIGTYLTNMKTKHLNHHFKNHNKNFGVTSPIWDFAFGTYN